MVHRLTYFIRAREGTGNRRRSFFFCVDFSPQAATNGRQWQPGSPASPADRQGIRQAFPPARYALRNTPEAQKRHRKPQKPHQASGEYRNTDPQRKTAPAAVKMAKRRGRPTAGPYACARVYSPRGCDE
nr:MAG TPA_asm: hypothetical protein [Caudoviricetes sp.]